MLIKFWISKNLWNLKLKGIKQELCKGEGKKAAWTPRNHVFKIQITSTHRHRLFINSSLLIARCDSLLISVASFDEVDVDPDKSNTNSERTGVCRNKWATDNTYLFIYVFFVGMSFLSEGHNAEYQRDLQDVFHMLRSKHGENVLVSVVVSGHWLLPGRALYL